MCMLKPSEYDIREHADLHRMGRSHRVLFAGSSAWNPDNFDQYEKVVSLPAHHQSHIGEGEGESVYRALQNHTYGFRDMTSGDLLHHPSTDTYLMKERGAKAFSVVSVTNAAWLVHSDAAAEHEGTLDSWKPENFERYTSVMAIPKEKAPIVDAIPTYLKSKNPSATSVKLGNGTLIEDLQSGEFFLSHNKGFSPVMVSKRFETDPAASPQGRQVTQDSHPRRAASKLALTALAPTMR